MRKAKAAEAKKAEAERLQGFLQEMLKEEENKYCADCEAKQPRWASWNIGVFLCIRCAGLHRNLGVHVSKVKSVTLDSWTPEQIQSMRVMGNAKARAVYECELPSMFRRPQTDQSLEAFIRAKYETKRYIMKDWVPPQVNAADLPTSVANSTTTKKATTAPPAAAHQHVNGSDKADDAIFGQFASATVDPAFGSVFAPQQQQQQSHEQQLIDVFASPSDNDDAIFGQFASATVDPAFGTVSAPQQQQEQSHEQQLIDVFASPSDNANFGGGCIAPPSFGTDLSLFGQFASATVDPSFHTVSAPQQQQQKANVGVTGTAPVFGTDTKMSTTEILALFGTKR